MVKVIDYVRLKFYVLNCVRGIMVDYFFRISWRAFLEEKNEKV